MNEVEKIIGIVKQINMFFVKIDKKIDVAVIVEAGCKYGTEYPQLCDLVRLLRRRLAKGCQRNYSANRMNEIMEK